MKIDDFVSKFENVHQSGKGWSARCPAHEDKHASLSISMGEDGRILLYCHAGCDTDLILEKINLECKDLFPENALNTDADNMTLTKPGFRCQLKGFSLQAMQKYKNLRFIRTWRR